MWLNYAVAVFVAAQGIHDLLSALCSSKMVPGPLMCTTLGGIVKAFRHV